MSLTEKVIKPNDPLAFLTSPRTENKKRSIAERRADFDEIYVKKAEAELNEQAARCLDCGNPYCEWKCPLHNYIPNWLELVKNNQLDAAAELMHQTNPLPEICGRVCPQDRLCEQACTLNTGFGAVNIGAIEKNVSDYALAKQWRPDLSDVESTNKTVAIVGAGPAGLGCAELLARNGVKPIVYDRYPEIGGLLTFGIPGFKLEKSVVKQRRKFLEDLGVEFHLNTEIGKDISFEEIQSKSDAVFLGMGCYKSVTGKLQGSESAGVIKALDYLIGNVNQQQSFGMDDYAYFDLKDKTVVVLGGGDTAMDCVRSAVRQDAKQVSCVYRRDKASMPGSPNEVKNATEEGVNFMFNKQPLEILADDNGQVKGVKCATTRLMQVEGESRSRFEVDESENQILEADVVILAFGFNASPADWFEKNKINTDQWGLIEVSEKVTSSEVKSQATSMEGVFAGGDMVRGADLVVTAIAEGRQAAREILEYLEV